MKRSLLLLSVFILLITSFGCRKIIGPREDRLEGNWQLKYIERKHLLNWKDVTNRYENGIFTFFDDGAASYRDDLGDMNGIWQIRTVSEGYYDEDGSWRNDSHFRFTLRLYNYADNRILDLEFDVFRWKGRNRFVALYDTPTYTYRYDFRRR